MDPWRCEKCGYPHNCHFDDLQCRKCQEEAPFLENLLHQGETIGEIPTLVDLNQPVTHCKEAATNKRCRRTHRQDDLEPQTKRRHVLEEENDTKRHATIPDHDVVLGYTHPSTLATEIWKEIRRPYAKRSISDKSLLKLKQELRDKLEQELEGTLIGDPVFWYNIARTDKIKPGCKERRVLKSGGSGIFGMATDEAIKQDIRNAPKRDRNSMSQKFKWKGAPEAVDRQARADVDEWVDDDPTKELVAGGFRDELNRLKHSRDEYIQRKEEAEHHAKSEPNKEKYYRCEARVHGILIQQLDESFVGKVNRVAKDMLERHRRLTEKVPEAVVSFQHNNSGADGDSTGGKDGASPDRSQGGPSSGNADTRRVSSNSFDSGNGQSSPDECNASTTLPSESSVDSSLDSASESDSESDSLSSVDFTGRTSPLTDDFASSSDDEDSSDGNRVTNEHEHSHVQINHDATNVAESKQAVETDYAQEAGLLATRVNQQRLLLLWHAPRCKHEAGGKCSVTKHCAATKSIWAHICHCKRPDCTEKYCLSSRHVLAHYRSCKDPHCSICWPVRKAVRESQAQGAQQKTEISKDTDRRSNEDAKLELETSRPFISRERADERLVSIASNLPRNVSCTTQATDNPQPFTQKYPRNVRDQSDCSAVEMLQPEIHPGVCEPKNITVLAPQADTAPGLTVPPIYLMRRRKAEQAYIRLDKKPLSLDLHGQDWGYIVFAFICHRIDDTTFQAPNDDRVKYVAIKRLNKAVVNKYLRQGGKKDPYKDIALMQELGDDVHVLSCIEALEDAEYLYIVIPKACSQGTLKDIIPWTDSEPMHPTRTRDIFIRILRILAYLEAHGICHSNLSPDNFIFLTPERLVVFDLALSVRIPVNKNGQRMLTTSSRSFGAIAYMAPEVCLNRTSDACSDSCSDLWSAALVLYNMLTNQVPYYVPHPSDVSFRRFVHAQGHSSTPTYDRSAAILKDTCDKQYSWQLQHHELLSPRVTAHRKLTSQAVDLLKSMLRMDPSQRLSLAQVMESSYVRSVDS